MVVVGVPQKEPAVAQGEQIANRGRRGALSYGHWEREIKRKQS